MTKKKEISNLGHGVKIGIGIAIGMFIILLIFFGGCSYLLYKGTQSIVEDEDLTPTITQEGLDTTSTQPKPKSVVGKINEIAGTDGFISVYVGSKTTDVGIGYSEPNPGNEFLILSVGVKNVGNSKHYFSPLHFTVTDNFGSTYEYSIATYSLSKKLGSVDIQPGNNVVGLIAFEIPIGFKANELLYQYNLLEDRPIVVKLS